MPYGLASWTRMNWKTIRRFSLMLLWIAATAANAQEALEEDFLLFLANGMEIDGSWQDPVSLSEMAEVQAMNDETNELSGEQEIAPPEEGDTNEN